ncbi:hypothetical protein COP2_035004 [Malus domestica]
MGRKTRREPSPWYSGFSNGEAEERTFWDVDHDLGANNCIRKERTKPSASDKGMIQKRIPTLVSRVEYLESRRSNEGCRRAGKSIEIAVDVNQKGTCFPLHEFPEGAYFALNARIRVLSVKHIYLFTRIFYKWGSYSDPWIVWGWGQHAADEENFGAEDSAAHSEDLVVHGSHFT